MFNRSEEPARRPAGAGATVVPLCSPAGDRLALLTVLAAVAAAAAALMLPLQAEAGRIDAPPSPPPEREAATDGSYQLRCWQYGRLLFEERALQLSTETVEGLKLSGTDRRQQPVMVTDTGNATCLIRRSAAGRKPYP